MIAKRKKCDPVLLIWSRGKPFWVSCVTFRIWWVSFRVFMFVLRLWYVWESSEEVRYCLSVEECKFGCLGVENLKKVFLGNPCKAGKLLRSYVIMRKKRSLGLNSFTYPLNGTPDTYPSGWIRIILSGNPRERGWIVTALDTFQFCSIDVIFRVAGPKSKVHCAEVMLMYYKETGPIWSSWSQGHYQGRALCSSGFSQNSLFDPKLSCFFI